MAVDGQGDSLELGAAQICLGQAVELCEQRVHHAPIRVEELTQRKAAGEHFIEKRFRLADHAAFQRFVVIGVEHLVRLEHADFSQSQPLRCK